MSHSSRNIKQQLDRHEFDFNPRSWDKMEALLEGKAPSKRSYFKTKTIFIMISFLLFLAYLFWQEPNPPMADFNTPQITAQDLTGLQNQASQTLYEPSTKSSSPNPEANSEQDAHSRSEFGTGYPPLNNDTSFFQNLTQKLNRFNQYYAPEKVYLQFDRTFFEPGETIWFNAFLRKANSLKDLSKSKILYVELRAPNGSISKKITLRLKNGRSAGDFQLDQAAPGGLYKIRAYTNWQLNTEDFFTRDVQVQASVLPRLRMEMDFQRETYGPGDFVEATLDLQSLANEPLAHHDFTARASLDGESFQEIKGVTDGGGRALVKITLPKTLDTNDGLLNVLIGYNGQTESISRSIPIVLNKIDLQFMPEGGDPIAGTQGKIAFKALNEFGKPADVEGVITDAEGRKITSFRSYHQGMGTFSMTPESGQKYLAYLTKPAGISTTYTLPEAKARGYAISVDNSDQEQLRVEINSTENEQLHLTLFSQSEIYFTQTLPAGAGAHLIKIPTKTLPIGTAQVTLFDSKEIPRAERLVFLNPHKKLNVEITTDKDKYLPREKVSMTIKVTDERGMPMPGQFALSVADDNLLTFADDKQGHILSHLLLESELKGEIVEPNFYFDKNEKHPEKDQLLALDHLMLTQGWRRFDWSKALWEQPVAMKYEREEAKLKGQLLDVLGRPMPGLEVALGKSNLTAVTDENGRFEMDTLVASLPRFQISFDSDPDRKVWCTGKLQNGQLVLPTYIDPDKYANQQLFQGGETEDGPPLNFDKHLNYSQLGVAEVVEGNGTPGTKNLKLIGSVKDVSNNGPIILGGVNVIKDGKVIASASTDFEGKFEIEGLEPGVYNLGLTRFGYHSLLISDIPITHGMANNIGARLDPNFQVEEIVVRYQKPLVSKDETTQGKVFSSETVILPAKKRQKKKKNKKRKELSSQLALKGQASSIGFGGLDQQLSQRQQAQDRTVSEKIKSLPTRNVNELASLGAGAKPLDDQIKIRGSRANGTDFYIDGVRVFGNTAIPAQSIEELESVQLGGTPAAFANEAELGGRVPANIRGQGNRGKMDARILRPTPFALSEKKEPNEDLDFDMAAQVNVDGQIGKKLKLNTNFPNQPRFNFDNVAAPGYNVTYDFHLPRQFYAPKYEVEREQPAASHQRTDFRKTVFWKPDLVTDRNGIATVEFYCTDAITTFEATVEGLGMDGGVGRGTQRFYTQLPFGMDVKIPTHLLSGDQLVLPLTLMNHTAQQLDGTLQIKTPEGFSLETQMPAGISLEAGETRTVFPTFKIGFEAQSGDLTVNFEAAGRKDAFTKPVKVQPRGFPVHQVFSGNQPQQSFAAEVNDPVENSLSATFTVYPSILSELTSGLEKIIRQPGGCFEQTSSSNYPNVLVMNLLDKTGHTNPELVKQTNNHLEHGYNRLKTFEVPDGGFDWFGNPPGHEALTAYGLLQFVDMKKVYPVEQSLIDRTAKWLLTRRDGQGSWKSDRRGLHSWKRKSPIADAYINWAMTEAGFGDQVKPEIEKTLKAANTSQDPYLLALAANILINQNDGRAGQLLAQLAELQAKDGSWTGLTHSMTRSKGKNLAVETTSLAVLAFLKAPELQIAEDGKWTPTQLVSRAVDYLASSKTHYGFGSTQATVLALKALVKHAENTAARTDVGPVAIVVNGQTVAEQTIPANKNEPVVFAGLADYFTEGKNQVKVKFADRKNTPPYDLSVSYHTRQPASNPDCALKLNTRLVSSDSPVAADRPMSAVKMGETVRLTTTITNQKEDVVFNPIAIVGLPAGLGVQPWQVKEMQERNLFDFYEISEDRIVFYFRHLEGQATKNIHLDLKAEIPGTFEAPASSAYLYYENDAVVWDKPGRVEVGN
ncbi:MAG: MG2 domain-containing protein [Bacteroidota bacterium]